MTVRISFPTIATRIVDAVLRLEMYMNNMYFRQQLLLRSALS